MSQHTEQVMARVALRRADKQVKKAEDEHRVLCTEQWKEMAKLWQQTGEWEKLVEERHAIESARALERITKAQAEKVKAESALEKAERRVRENQIRPFTKRSRSRSMPTRGPPFPPAPVRPYFASTHRGSMPSSSAGSMASSSAGSSPSSLLGAMPKSSLSSPPPPRQPWPTRPQPWETRPQAKCMPRRQELSTPEDEATEARAHPA